MSADTIEIAGRRVGYNHRPLVIAEIGINHGGDLETAKRMVDAAHHAGADIIKHQTHIPDAEMSQAARHVLPGNDTRSIYDVVSSCSLNEEEERELMEYTIARGATFLSTPFCREAVDRLEMFGVPAYKVGSGECTNLPLLAYIASKGKPVILSTGMVGLRAVYEAVDVLRRHGSPFVILHTTNLYPTPPHLVRLGAMTDLQRSFPDVPVGLSDHTTNNLACIGALALGASIVERHFTDSKDRSGPDISCSMDPMELWELRDAANVLAQMRGGSKNDVPTEEHVTRSFASATVVATENIPQGAPLTVRNVTTKRPGTFGIPAERYDHALTRCAARDICAGEHIDWCDLR